MFKGIKGEIKERLMLRNNVCSILLFLILLMTAEAIKTLLTVPSDVFTNFTAVTEGLAGAVISAGWKVLAVVVIVWGSKGVVRWASGLFKKSVR